MALFSRLQALRRELLQSRPHVWCVLQMLSSVLRSRISAPTGVFAVTVAVRGLPESNAISPKNDPSPISPDLLVPCRPAAGRSANHAGRDHEEAGATASEG